MKLNIEKEVWLQLKEQDKKNSKMQKKEEDRENLKILREISTYLKQLQLENLQIEWQSNQVM